ncbi:RNA polymerase sigma factor [Marivirga sp. S37H4]|uniref:RNA polymerase sigma factor n=1 Tax=Marivirga aurantiaca TaxID=2802615 RepID=A0A934X0K1_9BACT|nr:RNA polymerase sigma factor [Marivirga aurantiaca]MBK6266703.1 RNA polymerase sigma factor [Marivirga aurantiaca]
MNKEEKEQLFNSIVEKSRGSIYRVCLTYLREKSEVDDLYQEILIAVWQAMERFQERSSWNTYIYRIAINTAIKFNMRLKKNEQYLVKFEVPDKAEEVQVNNDEALNKLHHCIHQLNDSDRIIIGLILEDLSYKAIAEILQTDINNVGVKINRVKKRLSTLMTKNHGSI